MKKTYMFCGVIAALILSVTGLFASTNNNVVIYEEQISSSLASIRVQEKRRVDLIHNLVDTVQAYSEYESDTLQKITESRTQASIGNAEDAKMMLHAVAEQYPDLKASESFKQLMTELVLTENTIAEHRNYYNIQVQKYNKFVRKFPAKQVLSLTGYESAHFAYVEYDAPQDAPQNVFGD